MASKIADLIVTLDTEMTDQARQTIKQMVVEILQELFVETPWLEERVNDLVNGAMEKAMERVRLVNYREGA